jgi:hypothetical protein
MRWMLDVGCWVLKQKARKTAPFCIEQSSPAFLRHVFEETRIVLQINGDLKKPAPGHSSR